MNKLEIDAKTDETGALRIRLPGRPASYTVHVTVEWTDPDLSTPDARKAAFEAIRTRGHPEAQALLAKLGEDGIVNPGALLSFGLTADAPLEEPSRLAFEERDSL